jgi:heat shock protein HslJ
MPTARFELGATTGTVTGSGGCNGYHATFSSGEDGTIRISPAAATRKMCPEPGVMDQETRFFRALESAERFRIEGDRLELRTGSDALAVAFRAAPGGD